jgi:nucleoside-diphosphate-sugar epimerase
MDLDAIDVLVTGGAGFLGRKLIHALVSRGALAGPDGTSRPIRRIFSFDAVDAPALRDPRVVAVTGNIEDVEALDRLVTAGTTSIFHLAAVVSGAAEADLELGLRVNVDATRSLLDVCRRRGHRPRFVFTSSVAVYGGNLPMPVHELAGLRPQTSYGAEKAIAELLVSDYARRGSVDGRVLRLPTVSVRPGRPNAAASSFASGIIREPLNGEDVVCPVDPTTPICLISPASVIGGLIRGHEIDASALGTDPVLNLPSLTMTAGEMVAALTRVAGPAVAARVRWQRDDRIDRMVRSWPGACDATRADSLGFPRDANFDDAIRAYISDELPAHARPARG